DRLRMRVFLRATKALPHPEPVEGRTVPMQCKRCQSFFSVVSVHSAVNLFYAAAGLLLVMATSFAKVARALPLSIASAASCTPARIVATLPATSRAAALL